MSDFFDFWDELPEDNGLLPNETAYIKREISNFRPIFVLYDGLGQRIASAPTRQAAMMMAERAELTLCDVN